MKVSFVGTEDVATGIKTFWFKPSQKIRYIAGQFIELSLPYKKPDDRGTKRWFTLSSPPSEFLVSITTKISNKPSTFKQTLFELKKDDKVNMSSPMGDFILPKSKSAPVVFIAGGIGCTPFHSIIAETQINGENRDINLYYSVKIEEELAFTATFLNLGAAFHKIVGQSLNINDVIKNTTIPAKTHFYISGPEPMVEELEKELLARKIKKSYIHTDFFPGYSEI